MGKRNIDRLVQEIVNMQTFLYEEGILVGYTSLDRLVQRGKKEIRLGKAFLSKKLFHLSLKDYVSVVKNEYYGWLLRDGSVINMNYVFSSGRVEKYNLLFLSPPFLGDYDSDISYELANALCEFMRKEIEIEELFSLRTLFVRFDFNEEHDTEEHPASHCHVFSNSCRVPVVTLLTPCDFISTVFFLFNYDWWCIFRKKYRNKYRCVFELEGIYEEEKYLSPLTFRTKD